MLRVLLFFLFGVQNLFATHLLFNTEGLAHEKRAELLSLFLQNEPPRAFFQPNALDLKKACHSLAPEVQLHWIPPTAWQMAALHAFFIDERIRKAILACGRLEGAPLTYDEHLHTYLASANCCDEIAHYFDERSRVLPELTALFFQINQAAVKLFQRAGRDDSAMVRLILKELPSFSEWERLGFPFWGNPFIHNQKSVEFFHRALQDETLLMQLLELERIAHSQNAWVLYRGYEGSGFPTTLQFDGAGSHALSFGSTLLGGVFFSLEATALTYAKPHTIENSWSFLALSANPATLKQLFRVGPLHPFLQLLVDGEMFHAHTKIAEISPGGFKTTSMNGYFMECNRHTLDPIGYILAPALKPEELENQFQQLCEKSGTVFSE